VLVGFNMFQQDGSAVDPMVADQTPPISLPAVTTAQPGAVLAGFPQADNAVQELPETPSQWQEERIGGYLREHASQEGGQVTPQLLPSARAASMEGR